MEEISYLSHNGFSTNRDSVGKLQNEEYRKLKDEARECRLRYEKLEKQLSEMETELRNELLKDQPLFPEYALVTNSKTPLCLYVIYYSVLR